MMLVVIYKRRVMNKTVEMMLMTLVIVLLAILMGTFVA